MLVINIFGIILFLVLIFLPFILIAFYTSLSNLPGSGKFGLDPTGDKKKSIIPLPLMLLGFILFAISVLWLFSESGFKDRFFVFLLIGAIIAIVKLLKGQIKL